MNNKGLTLRWFYKLEISQQAVLLANPHGYLPDNVASRIAAHIQEARRDETPQIPRRWLLRSAEANLLEDERLRLDEWWHNLAATARPALMRSRGAEVPRECRQAVLDVIPGGPPAGTDLDTAFDMSGIAAAYLEMVAGKAPCPGDQPGENN